MTRLIGRTVVTMCLSLLLLVGCSGCITSSYAGTMPIPRPELQLPQAPGELKFMKTPSVLGMSRERVEEKLGPGELKPQSEVYCQVPLVSEKDQATGAVSVTPLRGHLLVYSFANADAGWRIKRQICLLNETVVSERFDGKWLEGTQQRQATQIFTDFELTRKVFWGEYKGDYRFNKTLKKSKGPKHEI